MADRIERYCSHLDCQKPHCARGLCKTHYRQLLRAIARRANPPRRRGRPRKDPKMTTPTTPKPRADSLDWLDWDRLDSLMGDRVGIPDDSWQADAVCAGRRDVDMFPEEAGGGVNAAKGLCARCPVVYDCLAYALITHSDHGVWGRCSMRERARIRTRRAMAAAGQLKAS